MQQKVDQQPLPLQSFSLGLTPKYRVMCSMSELQHLYYNLSLSDSDILVVKMFATLILKIW